MKNNLIVVLSGEIGCGKSMLAKSLAANYNFKILKTRDALLHYSKGFRQKPTEDQRMFLQRVGEQMDRRTGGKWIVEYFQNDIRENPRTVLDSSRIQKQIDSLRESYGYQNVYHVYINASERTLEERYFLREKLEFNDLGAIQRYHVYKSNPTERNVKELLNEADLVVDTDKLSPEDNAIRVTSFLRLLPEIHNQLVDIVVGGQFGSEGKGQISAFLSPEYDCLVRVGGPNAGHKVFEFPEPVTFHLLPSGTNRAPNSKIVIGAGAVISLPVILNEIKRYNILPDRLCIDELATIISNDDIKVEEELDKIGSTKQGVGAATANNLFIHRLQEDEKHKAKNCPQLKQYITSARKVFEKLYSENKKILLEGTQGTLLSLHHGIFPYVTSRDTSVSGCISEAGISPKRVRKIVMVTRTYPIRVQNPNNGTSGPFSRSGNDIEINLETIHNRSAIPLKELEKNEVTSTTKRARRIGEFNWGVFREACELNSPTDIALTFTDYLDIANRKARRFDQLTKATTKFIDEIERCAGVPASLIATDFSHRSIIDRRNWV